MRLTAQQRTFLTRAADKAGWPAEQSITNPTYVALKRRGLVSWEYPRDDRFGQWVPTDAGREALAEPVR
jgi:hypothetical protein